ncbi:MAG: nitrogen fixation protein [Coleofasciculus sp. C3-bin4]|nr:nitrogen fixation protein [Coleofasciculus sp. C3-bin4]
MPLCPSGRPEACEAIVFGVVGGTIAAPLVGYLTEPMPVNEDILALSGSVEPTEIFRIASTCAGHGCKHFDGSRCNLVMRIAEQLPAVAEALPACQIRPHCRWWQQEGKAACQRCPQVVTDNYYASDRLQQVVVPNEL